MEYVAFKHSLDLLRDKARDYDSILVSFSGGKDSWACLHLCFRAGFKKIQPFYMFIVPGLEVVDEQLAKAEKYFGVTIKQYPNWLLFRFIKYGVFCASSWRTKDMWEPNLFDLYEAIIADTKIDLICHGGKESDSIWRRKCYFGSQAAKRPLVYPLKQWSKFDVLAYLKLNKIDVPDQTKEMPDKRNVGIDLSEAALYWLHDYHPEDFKRLLKFFPFAESLIWKREWYGSQKKVRSVKP